VEIFPETLGPELDIPSCGFTFATGTYLTSVMEIQTAKVHGSDGQAHRACTMKRVVTSLSKHHKEMIHGSVFPE